MLRVLRRISLLDVLSLMLIALLLAAILLPGLMRLQQIIGRY